MSYLMYNIFLALLLDEHVLDARPIARMDLGLDLLFRQPFEVFDAHIIVPDVGLAGHYAAFHEEGLFCYGDGWRF